MEEEMQIIKKVERSNKVLSKKYAGIQNKYGDQFIAVDNGRIIAHNQKLDALRKYLEGNKIVLAAVVIEYIPSKGVTVLY